MTDINVYGNELSLFQKMIRRKPLNTQEISESMKNENPQQEQQVDENCKLKRVLGVFDIIAFGIAIAVGSGIFVIAGEAGEYSGPALFLSFIIGGISCLFCGLCYSEFATRIPVSGSAYTYAYCSLGEIIGFLIGWDLTLEYGISAATIAQGCSFYLLSLLQSFSINDIYLCDWLFGRNINSVLTINVSAGILIILMSVLLMKGIRESASFTNFITVWNITLIVVFSAVGCFFIDTHNWFKPCDNNDYATYCDSDDRNSMFPKGISGVLRASGIVFFSYVGFDSVSTLAEETKNPKRDMVIGILGTLGIATSLYVIVSLVLTGMIPFTALDAQSPLSQAFKDHNQHLMAMMVSIGALTTTTATTLTCLLGQPRIFYRMAHDGLFFDIFKSIKVGTAISGVGAALIATFINFNLLAEMISVGTLMAYILVCGGVIVLRYEDIINGYKCYCIRTKENENKYDTILTNNVPILVCVYAVFCIGFGYVMDITEGDNVYCIIVLVFIGIIICLLFGCILFIDWRLKRIEYVDIDEVNKDKVFLCPLCPYLPCLGIFVNSYMIASLKWQSFARVIIWFVFGFILYISYGSKNSKLNRTSKHEPLLEDDSTKIQIS